MDARLKVAFMIFQELTETWPSEHFSLHLDGKELDLAWSISPTEKQPTVPDGPSSVAAAVVE